MAVQARDVAGSQGGEYKSQQEGALEAVTNVTPSCNAPGNLLIISSLPDGARNIPSGDFPKFCMNSYKKSFQDSGIRTLRLAATEEAPAPARAGIEPDGIEPGWIEPDGD